MVFAHHHRHQWLRGAPLEARLGIVGAQHVKARQRVELVLLADLVHLVHLAPGGEVGSAGFLPHREFRGVRLAGGCHQQFRLLVQVRRQEEELSVRHVKALFADPAQIGRAHV